MKNLKKLLSICLALMMVLTCVPAAFAAEVDDCTIDEDAKASLTIWKFDWTNAYKDGVWDEDSFISTGWRESYVEEVLGETVREGDANGNPDHPLGNGQNSNGYALKGVEFTILRVADIVTFTESANDQHPDYNLTQVLYAFDKDMFVSNICWPKVQHTAAKRISMKAMILRRFKDISNPPNYFQILRFLRI